MKRYTLRAAIHDAKIFDQLRQEYRRAKKNRRKHSPSGLLWRYLVGMRDFTAVPLPVAARSLGRLRRSWQHVVEILAIIVLLR
jgi:hypothetical protein